MEKSTMSQMSSIPSTISAVTTTSMKPTFTTLPPEVRRQLYAIVLPSQDIPMKTGGWSKITNIPNEYMSLLRVNKQIFAEAQDVVYGCNSFTLTVSKEATYFLHNHLQEATDFRPFPKAPAIKNMKHWQVDLQFDPSYSSSLWGFHSMSPYLGSPLRDSQYYIRESILAATVEIVKAKDLQTMKICFPCLCGVTEKKTKHVIKEIRKAIASSIEPLQRLRFKCSVKFIASLTPTVTVDRFDYNNYEPPLTLLNSETSYTQCQQPVCLQFAESFEFLRRTLTSKRVAPLQLTPVQKHWLGLKQYGSALYPIAEPMQRWALFAVWCALENEDKIEEEIEDRCKSAKCFMDEELEKQERAKKRMEDAKP
ncbi:MAG: hypothetical protein Q9166_001045 [cf. Caloplaca sp. 2 TL-2023]